jgi:hypothetical protein
MGVKGIVESINIHGSLTQWHCVTVLFNDTVICLDYVASFMILQKSPTRFEQNSSCEVYGCWRSQKHRNGPYSETTESAAHFPSYYLLDEF